MSGLHSTIAKRAAGLSPASRDIALALGATLVVLAVNAATGFRTLSNLGGDNDSLLRLVEVRDLLGGQGWFDLHQYRMGPEGGFVMHWSRLVDAPIAAIILAVSAVTGSAAIGETVARVLWPALLYCGTLFFILRAARIFGGERAVLPSVIIGAAALHFLGIYQPAALDHHNIQLMLAAGSLCLLLEAPDNRPAAAMSGVCAALMLAVGMETAPYVAVIGLCVAGLFLFDGAGERHIARDFGLGFAVVSAAVFFATVPASGWGEAQCDAFSVVQFALAAVAGVGLAAVTSPDVFTRTRSRRLLGLALLGVGVGALLVLAFPQCLSAPYSGLDARLKADWLDHVSEAKSLLALIVEDPASVFARYITPLLAIGWMLLRLRRQGWQRRDILVGAVLIAAFIVSVWQVRGSTFSIAFAVIPLSAWVGHWRARAEKNPSTAASLRMAAVWLVSLNASWTTAAAAASAAFEGESQRPEAQIASVAACQHESDFAVLAGLPATTVLAISNLGSPILAYSGHRVFSGPYHRNIEGNLLALDGLMGSPDQARTIVETRHVGLVALCRGNDENRILTDRAPDGLLAGMMKGMVPDWLEPVSESTGKPLELYRVVLDR
ncbi:GtrA family protein [Mesorhizobium sp. CGMCC 1.15528]|uniref:GtrA family protein n=1 Tax=Mesorhizobium zhangyense TaxID=1776730 RepID=A0A7C9VFJ2_9HYPH|nr:GtrA family protein [Mesorhizobium zhangyense]NGN43732.1 GtrA family protein [Mesorhizobium zhangyense]